jgi:PAS domain-containing protein
VGILIAEQIVTNESFPEIWVKDNKIVQINKLFYDLFEYDEELINMDYTEVWYNLFRATINLNELDYDFEKAEGYIFTGTLGVRRVHIKKSFDQDSLLSKILFINIEDEVLDKTYNLLEDTNSIIGVGTAIIDAQSGVFLRANDVMTTIFKSNREDIIGYDFQSMFYDWNSSNSSEIWKGVIETGAPYHCDEFNSQVEAFKGTSWNYTLMPVLEDQ